MRARAAALADKPITPSTSPLRKPRCWAGRGGGLAQPLGIDVRVHTYRGNMFDAPPAEGGILTRGRYDLTRGRYASALASLRQRRRAGCRRCANLRP